MERRLGGHLLVSRRLVLELNGRRAESDSRGGARGLLRRRQDLAAQGGEAAAGSARSRTQRRRPQRALLAGAAEDSGRLRRALARRASAALGGATGRARVAAGVGGSGGRRLARHVRRLLPARALPPEPSDELPGRRGVERRARIPLEALGAVCFLLTASPAVARERLVSRREDLRQSEVPSFADRQRLLLRASQASRLRTVALATDDGDWERCAAAVLAALDLVPPQ